MATTITSKSGNKAVNIRYNEFNGYRATAVQIHNLEESVIEAKSFTTEAKAVAWANKMIN